MTSIPPPNSGAQPAFDQCATPSGGTGSPAEFVELRDIVFLLARGVGQIITLSLFGMLLAVLICWVGSIRLPVSTTAQVVFSFPGFERGENPDLSRFHPEDLRAPVIIAEALKRQQLDATYEFQRAIRAALTIEGLTPLAVTKDRERLQANGQKLPFYIPDEYKITLTLPRNYPLSVRQRELLLNEIVNIYRETFQKTYVDIGVQLNFGKVFDSLHDADFPEYEMILNSDIENANLFLNEQIGTAPTYRSPSTHLTFSDLRAQLMLFSHFRINEVLALIYANGLSRDRALALARMNFYLARLDDQLSRAASEESVYTSLLAGAQNRTQDYLLGIRAEVGQPRLEAPILDRGLIDSLLANDVYNSLVRQSIEMGLKTKRAQAERDEFLRRRDAFVRADSPDQPAQIALLQKSLGELEVRYRELVSNIRATYADFRVQEFADVIRVTTGPTTETSTRSLSLAAGFGAALGVFTGIALSLMGIYLGRRPSARTPS